MPVAQSKTLQIGRIVLMLMAFAIPLAFFRETMYLFQIKTLILQYGGLSLVLLIAIATYLNAGHQKLWSTTFATVSLLLIAWQIIKCWDSVAPIISWRQMTRIYWLPIIALSVPFFFREKAHFYKLIGVVVYSSLMATLYAWCTTHPLLHNALFGPENNKPIFTLDAHSVPVLGPILKNLFFTSEFQDVWERKVFLMENKGQFVFPLSSSSFFAGKVDAGTFGNKNFLSAYLTLTIPLSFYQSVRAWLSLQPQRYFLGITLALLPLISAIAGLGLILTSESRGAWLGIAIASTFTGIWALQQFLSSKKRVKAALGLMCSIVVMIGITASLYPERMASIFSATHGSNELRRLTWGAWLKAWQQDDEWKGFQSDLKRTWTGFGTYSFRVVYPKHRPARIFQLENNMHNSETTHPHNEYLGYLGELGLIGLLLCLALYGSILMSLFKLSPQLGTLERWLAGALLFAFLAQVTQQTVSVGLRYTGLAFQFWLTLGLVLTLLLPYHKTPHHAHSKWSSWVAPALLLFGTLIVMPNPSWPIQWLRAQHFFLMGQTYQSTVQDAMQRYTHAHKFLGNSLPKAQRQSFEQELERSQRAISVYAPLADRYFDASFNADPAHIEALYIGANMNLQFANRFLMETEIDKAHHLYQKALQRYSHVEKVSPYFVQLRYWQGVAHKGIGTGFDASHRQEEAEHHYTQALHFYDLYHAQDSVYPNLFWDRYYCHQQLEASNAAARQLIQLLHLKEHSSDLLSTSDPRFDARNLLQQLLAHLDGQSQKRASFTLGLLQQFQSSSCLLPFVPKTQRHIINSFRMLE